MTATTLRPELKERIVREAEAVRRAFPGRFRVAMESTRATWVGAVPVEGRDFPVVVIYPQGYPGEAPLLETPLPLPADCPHVLGRPGGRSWLCWFAPNGFGNRRWDPQRHTAATVLRAAQRWGLAFLVWQELGVWPVPDAWGL